MTWISNNESSEAVELYVLRSDGTVFVASGLYPAIHSEITLKNVSDPFEQWVEMAVTLRMKEVTVGEFVSISGTLAMTSKIVSALTKWSDILRATKRLLIKDFKLICAGESLRKYTNVW